jgi:hypothetical protein
MVQLSRGGLHAVYTLSGTHFHWGDEKTSGSEHTLNGRRWVDVYTVIIEAVLHKLRTQMFSGLGGDADTCISDKCAMCRKTCISDILSNMGIWIHAYRCKFVLSKVTNGSLTGFWTFFSPSMLHCPNFHYYLLKNLYQASQNACQSFQQELCLVVPMSESTDHEHSSFNNQIMSHCPNRPQLLAIQWCLQSSDV